MNIAVTIGLIVLAFVLQAAWRRHVELSRYTPEQRKRIREIPKGLSGIEGVAWVDHGIRREPGETERQLELRWRELCMNKAAAMRRGE